MLKKSLFKASFIGLLTWLSLGASVAISQDATTHPDVTFNLIDTKGEVTEKSYEGKYLLLSIGYTSCPDICPATLYEFGKALKAIDNPEALQMIFVTIDPVNDEINRLNAYTQYFDPRIVGLSGTMENIENLTKQLGGTFGYRKDGKKVDKPELGMTYEVYHSALIYLISPDRKLIDVYDYQIGIQGLIDALNEVLPKVEGKTQSALAETSAAQEATTEALKLPESCSIPSGFVAKPSSLKLTSLLPEAEEKGVSLLNLWALWCAPCRHELPLLDQYQNHENFKLYTLNLGDSEADIKALFQELKLKALLPTYTQRDDILEQLGAFGLPFNALFIDGVQVASKAGIINEAEILETIKLSRCLSQHSQP